MQKWALTHTTVSFKVILIMNFFFIDIFEKLVQYNNKIYFQQWEHARVGEGAPTRAHRVT